MWHDELCGRKTSLRGDTCIWCGRDKREAKGNFIRNLAFMVVAISGTIVRIVFFHNVLSFDSDA
jgi:hypothetical protein